MPDSRVPDYASIIRRKCRYPAAGSTSFNELAVRAKPYARRDLDEVTAFAKAELGLERLEAWDLAYASEKLRVARYAFSDQEVKQYFPETTVMPGMFKLIETLYGLTIEPAEAPLWHDDVRFYA